MIVAWLCMVLGLGVALAACYLPVWPVRVVGRVVVVTFVCLFLSSFAMMIIAVDISDPGPGGAPHPYTAAAYLNIYGLSLSLGLLAGEREWRRGEKAPRPAPKLILEILAHSAIFAGALWVVALYGQLCVKWVGLYPEWALAGVGVISLVPGSLTGVLACRAYKARQRKTTAMDEPA